MTEWGVFLTVTAIAGFFMTIGVPIINLNKTITILNVNVENMNKRLDKQEKEFEKQQQRANDSHQKLWDKNDEQDSKLIDHETRISILEKSE